ncbi:MAG: WG repeat-containing protein [Ruminococcus sp.]|nr:WG repeat-containing protein [Ruminococcus sp.]
MKDILKRTIILSAALLLLTSCASSENSENSGILTELQNVTSVKSESTNTEQTSVTAGETDVHEATEISGSEKAEEKITETTEEIIPEREALEMLFPVYLNGYFEYIDKSGNIVTDDKFDNANFFGDGSAAVCKDSKWGFINGNGKEIIPCIYEYAGDFSDGPAAVKSGAKYGFINTKGKTVIAFEFDRASDFSEGYAYVVRESPYGEYIDKSGKKIFGTGMHNGARFSEGRAVLSSYSGPSQFYAVADTQGNMLFTNDYLQGTYISHYECGMAFFPIVKDEKIKYIYVDKLGNNCFDDYFDDAYPFSEELAIAEKDGKRGVIDKTGEFVFYNDGVIGTYSEGYITYLTESGENEKYGFLDKNGNTAIPAKYDKIYKDFRDGLALAELGGKLTYIDTDGNEIFSFEKPEDMLWALY